jgi:ABC-type branched-subunit amino acid transport system ATPase component
MTVGVRAALTSATPSEGLAPLIVHELLQTLVSLRDTGMTIGVG